MAAAASLVTFPVCLVGGQAIAGVLIQGAKLSTSAAKAVATVVGGMAGSGINQGFYVLHCEIEGTEPQTLGLVLSGVGGFLEGSTAAYLGAKLISQKFKVSSLGEPAGFLIKH